MSHFEEDVSMYRGRTVSNSANDRELDLGGMSAKHREKHVADKLSTIIDVMADLTDAERLRIIKTSQAFYGAWGRDTPWGNNSRTKQ